MNLLRDSQLSLLWTARIDYAKGSKVESHLHTDYDQLLVVLSGKGKVTIGQQCCEMKEGAAYLFLKGVSHCFQFSSPSVTLDFKFRIEDPKIVDCLSAVPSHCACAGSYLPELKQYYKMSLLHARKPGTLHPLTIESGFKGTLVSMMTRAGAEQQDTFQTMPPHDDNDPIVHYMKSHFADKITLDLLARHFGFNPNYLIKRFHDKTGMTPIQYLQEIRLEKAKEYLEFTALPISEIAEKVGWTQAYFSKILKKRIGQSPSQYRESLLNAIGKDINLEQDFSNVWRIVTYDRN
ncbi:helix-turn-helix domain-containing protein [Paenibacillus sp. NPDC056579]|uniref:AraC family transcriptional regulator n=1 Tax=unclassified Paenibacillus TaxID=185978 RepID=UPI001EF86E52|nr:AraC family transcriptional regulator [Paenibacillus sp. H1-7]ULL17931.1 AraC family transcriptional regulator [Paenibacillus sp. H1-7]